MFGRPKFASLAEKISQIPKGLYRSEALIGGSWKNLSQKFAVCHPNSGEVISNVSDCQSEHVLEAVEASKSGFEMWKAKTAKERAAIVQKWGTLIDENQESLATLITLEGGKPIAESRGEISYASSFCEWSASQGRLLSSESVPSPFPDKRILTMKQAIGVVGMITPWNFPAAMVTRKAAPALAVGCPVVLKPSEETPLTALALGELALQAGIPPECFHVLPASRESTPSLGKTICEHPEVRAISFTGSTNVGESLLQQSASTVKKVSLELGGLAPFIVFESADLATAAKALIAAKFRNTGQTCIAANNVFVHRSVMSEFIEIFKFEIARLKFGDVFDSSTTVGCLINSRGAEKVQEQVHEALEKGARLHCGGSAIDATHFEPTLLSDVAADASCFSSETFGPLCAIRGFDSEEEILALANASPFGLAGYFFSTDHRQCFRVAEKLEVGMVGINSGAISCCEAPFGGVKKSGLGREGGLVGTDEFTELKYCCFGDL